jgi:Undecaprenyl-phosphate glucose phosphotransferase
MLSNAHVTEVLGRVAALPRPLSPTLATAIVALSDAAMAIGSGLLIALFYVAEGRPDDPLLPELSAVVLYAFTLLLVANAAGLYRFGVVMDPAPRLSLFAVICCLVFLVLVAAAFALKISSQFSRAWAFSWLLSTVVVGGFARVVAARTLRRLAHAGRIARTVVVFGAGSEGRRLIETIKRQNEPWNRVVAVFDDRIQRTAPLVAGVAMKGNLADLIRWSRANRPDDVLVALPLTNEHRIMSILQALAVLPANVRLGLEFRHPELLSGRLSFQFGLPMLVAHEAPLRDWERVWKRLFDLLLVALVLVPISPLMLLIGIAIKLGSPGPALFRQPRYGFNNKMIEVYKFRTMRAEAADPQGVRSTERDDPRVTRLGAFLRRTSLDEMPQIINVLRGEMSIVGPRPHAERTTAGGRLCDEVVIQYAVRHKVKPGITGWAQVNGWRGTMETEEALVKRVEHDLYYIKHWSPWLDIVIIARTAWSVFRTKGCY